MSRQRGGLGHDALGLLLFGLAAFGGVSIAMASGGAPQDPDGMESVFLGLVGTVGALPGIVLCLGLAILGGRLWMQGVTAGLLRHLLGLAGTTLAAAVLLGAMSELGGGAVGEATGGLVARSLTPWVGVPFGLAVLALVSWYAWLRPRVYGHVNPEAEQPPEPVPADADAVSEEEALALLPRPRPIPPAPPRVVPSAQLPTGDKIPAGSVLPSSAPSPYPPDVRLHGGIPEGARPLERTHAPTAAQAAPDRARVHAPVQPSAEQPRAGGEERPGAHLAADARGTGVRALAASEAGLRDERAGDSVARAELRATSAPAGRDLAPPASAIAPVVEVAPSPAAAVVPLAPVDPPAAARPFDPQRPRPIWEHMEEDEDEELALDDAGADEEEADEVEQGEDAGAEEATEEVPVDAYGTPLTLVESLRRANARTRAVREASDELADQELRDAKAPEELDEDEDLDEDGEATEETEDAEDTEDEVLVAEADEVEGAAEETDEDELEVEQAGAELEEDDVEELDEEEPEEEDEQEEQDLLEDEADADDEPEEELESSDAAAELAKPAVRQLSFLGEEPRELDPVAADAREPETEPQVELQPVRPPAHVAAASADGHAKVAASSVDGQAKVAASGGEEQDLVYRAGCLFLERGRVAVSMLQREFDLDFKQATAVLDQLQDAGLIGPYLGGQRRDILLNAEKWREVFMARAR